MKQSLWLKQPELIVTQLHFLMVEIISALSVRTLLETLNWILNNILPDDGKRKNVARQPFDMSKLLRGGFEQSRPLLFCPAQNRRSTEGAAMLVRLDFYQNSFLKKTVPSREQLRLRVWTIPYKKTLYYFHFRTVGLQPAGRILSFPVVFRCGSELPQQRRYRGRRNRPHFLTLPRIKGEKMKYIPDDYGERCQFDAFCKTVLRHEAMNYFRELNRQRKRAIQFSTLCQHEKVVVRSRVW